jgi:hypothetical protein
MADQVVDSRSASARCAGKSGPCKSVVDVDMEERVVMRKEGGKTPKKG